MMETPAFRHTILLVDDEPFVLTALNRLLGRLGQEIVTCGSGAEALDILGKKKVSVLISDQKMPGMTGVELLEKTRELQPETVRVQ